MYTINAIHLMDVPFIFLNEEAVCNVRTLYMISISLFTEITLVNHSICFRCVVLVFIIFILCSMLITKCLVSTHPFDLLHLPHHLVFPLFFKHKILFSFMKFLFGSNFDFLESCVQMNTFTLTYIGISYFKQNNIYGMVLTNCYL